MRSVSRIGLGVAAACLAAAAPVTAQDHAGHGTSGTGSIHVTLADGWHARLDRPSDAALEFTTMPPGWHVTSGPSAIVYHPERVASGTYRLDSKIYLFDPGERREGFGLFIGGRHLEGADQSYTYFLLRRDGRFLIKRRAGAETTVVTDWTSHPAIRSWENRGENEATAENDLAIDVQAQDVVFLVNGQEVARLPRGQVDTEGVVGLRVNHGLNLHVATLDLTS